MLVTLLAVIGPGLLAGLSDDDPAGITTYSLLGAEQGYRYLWVIVISTGALIVFHDLGARMGIVTGRGLTALVRLRYGSRKAWALMAVLLAANLGTTCAELAGVAAGAELAGIPRAAAVSAAALFVAVLLLRGSFRRIEHVLLGVSTVFVAYIAAAVMAHPDWSAVARGLVVPTIAHDRDAVVLVVATIGTTLAPWGLTFIQSYAADKHLLTAQIRAERFDVVLGAVLTGVIAVCIAVACAATIPGVSIDNPAQAAEALGPAVGSSAELLFGVGIVGAGLLAAAILPLATAYSVCEAADRPARLGRGQEGRLFEFAVVATLAVAGVVVCVPAVPLIPVLYLTQALNAVLLVPVLFVIRRIAMDRALMGEQVLSTLDRWVTAATLALIAAATAALFYVTLT